MQYFKYNMALNYFHFDNRHRQSGSIVIVKIIFQNFKVLKLNFTLLSKNVLGIRNPLSPAINKINMLFRNQDYQYAVSCYKDIYFEIQTLFLQQPYPSISYCRFVSRDKYVLWVYQIQNHARASVSGFYFISTKNVKSKMAAHHSMPSKDLFPIAQV